MSSIKPQNFWELASIQVASVGIPGMVLGRHIALQYGAGNAIGAILIGNLLIWLIALIIISMSYHNRTDAIQNVQIYLGRTSAFIASFCVIVVFIFWFIYQLKVTETAFSTLFLLNGSNSDSALRMGATLGLWGALLSIGGITMLKWLNVIFLPILLIFQSIIFFSSGSSGLEMGSYWGFSSVAILQVFFFNLAAVAVLPTCFCFSRSFSDSVFALTVIFFINVFVQTLSIGADFDSYLSILSHGSVSGRFLLMFFLVFSGLCSYVYNIYYVSSAWKWIFRSFSPRTFVLIGLVGTSGYTFLQISPPMIFIRNVGTDLISNLLLMLTIVFIGQFVARKKSKTLLKNVGTVAWLCGSLIALITNYPKYFQDEYFSFISYEISSFFFVFVLFLDDTIYYFKKLWNEQQIKN